MKKIWMLSMCTLLSVMAVGCGNNPGEADPKAAATPEMQQQMDTDVGTVPDK